MNIDQGVWYRRDAGGMFAARESTDGRFIVVQPLHPNTLEPDGDERVVLVATFARNYCRASELS